MPNKIQRVASGLLSLTGITGGRNPDQLSDVISPTLDLLEHYAVQTLDSERVNSAANAVGSGADVDVPQGEVWRVLSIDTRMTGLTAAQVILTNTSIRPGGTGTTVRVIAEPAQTVLNTGDEILVSSGPVELWLPPGSRIQGLVAHPIGAAVTMGVGVLFQRLRV